MSRNQQKSVHIESLEHRTFLAAAQIHFANFASAPNLVTNGYDGPAITKDSQLALTSDNFWQSRSVWYDTRVPIERFRTDFTFRSSVNDRGADGFTFTILNGPTDSLGADGRGLGYGNIAAPSQALAFNQFNFNKFGSRFGFASNGERPPTGEDMPNIDLHSGHVFRVTATYDGATMKVAISDAADRSKVFSSSKKIDLKGQLGSADAIVGFTGSTGANRAPQSILSWSFTGEAAAPAPAPTPPPAPAPAPVPAPSATKPSITIPANATSSLVTGKSTTLDVLGDDIVGGEDSLSYTWRAIAMPTGVKAPTYTDNKTNSAKRTTAFFSAEGSYRFRVTVKNGAGLTRYSDVDVDVTQVATTIRMSPHRVKMEVGERVQVRGKMFDQFNNPMRAQPKFRYSVRSGAGTIGAGNGKFTAASTEGHVDIRAAASGLSAQIGITVFPHEDGPTGTASA